MADYLAIVSIFVAGPAIVTLTALWLSARARARRAEAIIHQLTIAPALRGEGPPVLDLNTAVDAIAIEVERISEGQRFIAKVLGDRPAKELSAPPGVCTPH